MNDVSHFMQNLPCKHYLKKTFNGSFTQRKCESNTPNRPWVRGLKLCPFQGLQRSSSCGGIARSASSSGQVCRCTATLCIQKRAWRRFRVTRQDCHTSALRFDSKEPDLKAK